MEAGIYTTRPEFRSRLSFMPLIRTWQQIAATEKGTPAKICNHLVRKFMQHPELTEVIDDYTILEQHSQLIEEAMATFFPSSLSLMHQLNAVAVPFSHQIIHASHLFRTSFMDESGNYMQPLDLQVEDNLAIAKEQLAYKLILKTFYHIDLAGGDAFICAYPDPAQDIHNYFELTWNAQFIDVTTTLRLPSLPKDFTLKCHSVNELDHFPEVKTILPIDEFIFDGLIVIHIKEVTERETINKIKDILQNENALEDADLYSSFKTQLTYLIHREEANVGFIVFNDRPYFRLLRYTSVLLRNANDNEKENLFKTLQRELQSFPHFTWNDSIHTDSLPGRILKKEGYKNVLISALYHNNKVTGCLEICTKTETSFNSLDIAKVEQVTGLLQNALKRYSQYLQNEVNRLVKEHFTDVQSAVEWKFNETVLDYLEKLRQGEHAEMQPIIFDHVYPLYGSIDIRNSSSERNHAVQQDMSQQLHWIRNILLMAQEAKHLPFLDEVIMRIDDYSASISNFLFAADEQAIHDFLRSEAMDLLQSIQETSPEVDQQVDVYFKALDPSSLRLNMRQKQFEESVKAINNHITNFLQREQLEAQQAYPHYFERFVTDGVEMNIYIGQSIAPSKKFNKIYLKNMQLWLVNFLAQAGQQIGQLSPKLAVPLETTQLILVYHEPIRVQFRTEERKFDVEGMYNVRYEVVKKRIDKALVKDTNQRLTQPGTIAIVYSHSKDAKAFMQHIQFLQKQQILEGEVEHLELEEMQGVSGLKALRVHIRLQTEETGNVKRDTSNLIGEQ
ncbi:hypothetical protein OCK74_24990 [Chitinophagaceae bacterium LB-8]|uniref:GAF domain-containing protein n=1 Tax=Paraflavisolibacter caeni TaxID=2982496 RepID=A0A9X2Y0I0_9BACT|nr:hypothetical protein [Paraflavisolibacter caeni]MCU7552400.1 hypothetical protein [Paraflavisolibacter caeni]